MVDYEMNLDGWLEDVTLFSNEPSDYNFNFDLLKANNEVAPVTEFNDLPWYDEKVNLTIFEDPIGQLDPVINFQDPNNIQLSETDIKELLSLISNSDTSYLPSDILSSVDEPNALDFELNEIQNQVSSPGSSTDFPYSPEYDSVSAACSPASYAFSPDYDASVDSPASVESADASLCSVLGLTPENVPSITSSTDQSCSDSMPAVFVTVCDHTNTEDAIQATEDLSIEELSDSVQNRKFVNNGKDIPKVRVSFRNSFHPYSKGTSRRGSNKSERKKVQNKEAAARYRVKKRVEEQELSGEVAGLEAEQKILQSKHDDLATEIKYLKKLMREILQKKGIL